MQKIQILIQKREIADCLGNFPRFRVNQIGSGIVVSIARSYNRYLFA